ncbi:hypothetical protein U9M48_014293 [Paspalum notatum var. saurae]|uniref:Uncharacterized protein n=1 Tax=Paspalum notatum var. saurae TaxID=547442 RepID=A0AAQ3T404_PASNO
MGAAIACGAGYLDHLSTPIHAEAMACFQALNFAANAGDQNTRALHRSYKMVSDAFAIANRLPQPNRGHIWTINGKDGICTDKGRGLINTANMWQP